MTRRLAIPALVLVLALGSALAGARALAQDPGPVPDDHPLVGSWIVTFPGNPIAPPSLYTFDGDGTVIGSSAAGARHGSWIATGDRTGTFTVVGASGIGSAPVAGLVQLSGSADVAESGDSFTLAYQAAEIAPDGTLLPAEGTFTAQGLRISVELTTAPGTPTLEEETVEADETAPAGTPGTATPVAEVISTALATAIGEEGTPTP